MHKVSRSRRRSDHVIVVMLPILIAIVGPLQAVAAASGRGHRFTGTPSHRTAQQPKITTTNPPDRPSPAQPQQSQGLDYFLGSWSFSWTGRESPITAGPRSGTVTFTRIADSDFMEMRAAGIVEGGATFRESGVLGWNEAKKVLAVHETLLNGADLLSLGDWSSPIAIRFDAAPVRAQGKLVRLRRTYSVISAAVFSVVEELSIDDGSFVRLGTGTFKKSRSATQ